MTQAISSAFYFGMMPGALLSAYLPQLYGRKNVLIYTGLLQGLCSYSSSYASTILELILYRVIFGICYGLSIPLSAISMLEISPMVYRGKILIILNFFTSFGRIIALICSIYLLEGEHADDWRRFMLYTVPFTLLAPILVAILTHESPRYLLTCQENERAFDVIEHMQITNQSNHNESLNEDEKNTLV